MAGDAEQEGHDEHYGETKRLFHTVRHNPPRAADFLSGERMGRPKPRQEHKVRLWEGFSTFDTIERAREVAQQFNQGDFIAELELRVGGGIQFEKTLGPGHYTVWGDPGACTDCVKHVYPVGIGER